MKQMNLQENLCLTFISLKMYEFQGNLVKSDFFFLQVTKMKTSFQNFSVLFYFLLPYKVEKVQLLPQLFGIKIQMDLQVLRSPESEKSYFQRLIYLYVYACYQHSSLTNCSRNFKFNILYLYHMQMLLFMKIGKKTLCTG